MISCVLHFKYLRYFPGWLGRSCWVRFGKIPPVLGAEGPAAEIVPHNHGPRPAARLLTTPASPALHALRIAAQSRSDRNSSECSNQSSKGRGPDTISSHEDPAGPIPATLSHARGCWPPFSQEPLRIHCSNALFSEGKLVYRTRRKRGCPRCPSPSLVGRKTADKLI